MQQQTEDDYCRRDLPPVGPDGVRRWSNQDAVEIASTPAPDDIESRILATVGDFLCQAFDRQHEQIQIALDRRDARIDALERRLDIEIALKTKLATLRSELDAARSEVAETRRLQPHYEGKLNVLQGQVEKLAKQTSRLRGEQSQLDFRQRESNKRITTTRFEVTSVGEQTREVLQRLRASGFELMDETPLGLAS